MGRLKSRKSLIINGKLHKSRACNLLILHLKTCMGMMPLPLSTDLGRTRSSLKAWPQSITQWSSLIRTKTNPFS